MSTSLCYVLSYFAGLLRIVVCLELQAHTVVTTIAILGTYLILKPGGSQERYLTIAEACRIRCVCIWPPLLCISLYVLIWVCAESPPHIAWCVWSVQERIGTYSGTYRNGNKTATLGQGVQAQLDKPSGSCRAISPFTDFVEELYRMCRNVYGACANVLRFTRIREGCTERIRTYNFPQKSFILCGERIRNVYGTYRNV